MVSISLGCQSTVPAHRGERAGSDSDRCSSVGSQLERLLHHMLYCDNQTVVAVMNSRSSRDRHLMHLLRCLFFYEACRQFKLRCSHIPGSDNGRADDLSRDNLSAFFLKVPTANKSAAAIPAALPNLLLSTEVDWISPAWIHLFNSTLNRAWPSPPIARTGQQ